MAKFPMMSILYFLLIFTLIGCSNETSSPFKEADTVAHEYFKAFVNKDHEAMIKHYTPTEKEYVLENGFLKQGEVEYQDNFKKLKNDYMLAGYSKYNQTENTMLYWGKYFSPAENGEERNMWIMLKKKDGEWVITDWKFRNKSLQRELYDSVNAKDENTYLLNSFKE